MKLKKPPVSAIMIGLGLLALGFVLGRGSIAPGLQEVRYDCSAPRDVSLKTFPFIDFPDGLELFMAGWISQGQLTITGVPQPGVPNTKTIVLGGPTQELREHYDGEWYDDEPIQLRPEPNTSCSIKIIYRVRSTLSRLLGG